MGKASCWEKRGPNLSELTVQCTHSAFPTAEGTQADELEVVGTVNYNDDEDYGFKVKLLVPWEYLGGRPSRGEVLKAFQRHHYKDNNKEKPAWKYEDAAGMSVLHPQEWLSVTLN